MALTPAHAMACLGIVASVSLVCACSAATPVGPGPGPTPTPTPTATIPVPFGDAIFVGAGDIADCQAAGSERTARLLDDIGGLIFALGDNAYFQGTAEDYRKCYEPTWGRHKERTRPTPGNHEYESAGAIPYFNYFGDNAGPFGRGYYSFSLGAWHVISLNSNLSGGSSDVQLAWLRDDLLQNPRPCTLAFFHHPLFSSGPNGNTPSMRDIWRVLYDNGVDVVLSAHDHLYERFAPQDPNGVPDAARGIRQFVVGTGGAQLSRAIGSRANSETRASVFGVLMLKLESSAYSWQFMPVAGETFSDASRGVCH